MVKQQLLLNLIVFRHSNLSNGAIVAAFASPISAWEYNQNRVMPFVRVYVNDMPVRLGTLPTEFVRAVAMHIVTARQMEAQRHDC